MIIGLTGRVGVGKSAAMTHIQDAFKNCKCIDLDQIGHELLKQTDIITQCVTTFGSVILDSNHQIDRKQLGAIVFNNSKKLLDLNAIIHPEILKEVLKLVDTYKLTCHFIVIVGALIKEIKLSKICDKIITIDANDTAIVEKIGEKFKKIACNQQSRQDYIHLADTVVFNNFDLDFKHNILNCINNLIANSKSQINKVD